ncbi:MAG: NUDIX domain-containing protein [Bacilli bacterium]|nr:NUDIX domain-containing protein [Bacilli bacterium]
MEKVDIYNNRHEKLNYTKGRKELKTGEYRLSCFAWIINDKDEILIQQRTENAKNAPNMWETVSGGATEGDTSLNGILRELDEELGIQPDIKDLTFIGSYIRYNDFVEVWVLKSNILLEELNLQKEEVQAVKWVTIASYEKMIQEGIAIETAFALFQNYYNQYYGKQLFFKEGTPTICSILK